MKTGVIMSSTVVELHDDKIVIYTERRGDKRFYHLLARLAALHACKTTGYGSNGDPLANLRRAATIGLPAWVGTTIRMFDKWHRITEYLKRRLQGNREQLGADTLWNDLGDNASYSLLTYIFLEEEAGRDAEWMPYPDLEEDRILCDFTLNLSSRDY